MTDKQKAIAFLMGWDDRSQQKNKMRSLCGWDGAIAVDGNSTSGTIARSVGVG